MQQQTRETGAECVMRRRRPALALDGCNEASESELPWSTGHKDCSKLAVHPAWRRRSRACASVAWQIRFVVIEGIKTTRAGVECRHCDCDCTLQHSSVICLPEVRNGGSKGQRRGLAGSSAGQLDKSGKSPRPKSRYPETFLPLLRTSSTTASRVAGTWTHWLLWPAAGRRTRAAQLA